MLHIPDCLADSAPVLALTRDTSIMLGALERRFGAQELESSSDLDETTVPPPVASGRGAVATVSAHKSASRGEAEVSSSKQFKPAATAAPGVEKLGSGLLLVNTVRTRWMFSIRVGPRPT